MKQLYDNIRKYRLEQKLTQQQLADLAGYTDRSSIAKIEKGLVDISQSKVELFAKVLHVSPGQLMGSTEADSAPSPHESNNLTAPEIALIDNFRQLNEEGQEKVGEYAEDLVRSGRYKKRDQSELGKEA